VVTVRSSDNSGGVTRRGVLILAIVTISFTIVTILAITALTHNFYVSGYYTISALFDAVGVDESSMLTTIIPDFSQGFYVIFGLSVVAGLIKIAIVGFVMAALIQIVTSLDLGYRLSAFSKRHMKGHIIICGYSQLADRVAEKLKEKKTPFIVIDKNPAKIDTLRELGYNMLHEDFTRDVSLINAGIGTAKAVMFLNLDDYSNLLGVITARHLNKDVKIIARAGDDSVITKIHRAGAGFCIVPEVLAGLEIGEAVMTRK